MDSFERNKIAGAVLGSALIGLGLTLFSDILFSSEAPEHPGYVIAVAEPAAAEGAAAPAAAQPIGVLLASADAGAGEASAKKCGACHTFGSGEANKVGPNLYGIVDRPIASHEGYEYDEAMKKHAEEAKTWSYDNLNVFLTDPKATVPGTKMAFAGLKSDAERANVIAYLRTLSPNPAPLPPAEAAAPAPADGSAPAPAQGEASTAPAEGGAAPAGQAADAAAGAGASSAPDQQGATPQVAPVEQPAPEPGQPAADAAAAAPDADTAATPAPGTAEPAPPVAAPAPAPAEGAAAPATPQPGAPAPAQQTAAAAPSAQSPAPAAPAAAQAPAAQAPAAQAPAAAAPAGGGDFAALVSSSDPAAGAGIAKRCAACHSLVKDGPNKIGPHIWGVVNRPIGSIADYNYSAAFKAFAAGGSKTWTVAELDPWLLDPKAHVPGTKMAFPGLRKDNERAAVIKYLETLSDTPPQ